MIDIISSMITWIQLEERLAKALDIYPILLHAQYHLSTDKRDLYPCDLTSSRDLATLIAFIRLLVDPGQLANGQCSVCKMRALAVQIFNKGDRQQAVQSDGKVSCI